jgi:dolichol-phosphate mannosyltransferase
MGGSGSLKILAIIPVYRDIGAAVKVLRKFRAGYVDRVFLVVDAPKENDEKEMGKTIAGMPTPVSVVVHEKRNGIGYAIREGIDYGLAHNFDIAVVLAGNNKDNPHEIPSLLAPILEDGFDYVQGSRFLPGGKKINNPFFRGIFSRLYPFVWTLFTKKRCTDVTNGFRAYKLNIFLDKRFNIHQNWLDSYQLEYYIHYKVLTLRYKMKEVPISKVYAFRHKGGYSNISPFKDWWQIVGPLLYLKFGIRK